jgi:hypothetical protein
MHPTLFIAFQQVTSAVLFLAFLLHFELSDSNNQKGRFKMEIRGQYRVTTY